MEENKKRILFWGFMLIVFAGLGIFGIMKFYDGYGKIGQARKKLTPIAEKFNQTDLIIKAGNLEAEVSGDKIIVTDKIRSTEYEYKYSNENGKEIITNTYTSLNSTIGEIVAKGMIDAVYRLNGGSGSVFNEYQYSIFTNTTIDNGVSLENGSSVVIRINVNANIVDNIKNLKLNLENSEVNAINVNDLSDLKSKLSSSTPYLKKKSTITIYVKEFNNYYEIYGQNSSESVNDELYASFMNTIRILNTNAYNIINNNGDYLNQNTVNDDYEVQTNYNFNEPDIFESLNNITKVTIKKA